jgi:ATP-dependent helicase HrpB
MRRRARLRGGQDDDGSLALLDAQLNGQSIVMLEPRRVATRAAAWRLADLRGEEVGQTVGFACAASGALAARRASRSSPRRATRRLRRDPTLDSVGILVFDEFHERSLDADFGLALALRTRRRDDLRRRRVGDPRRRIGRQGYSGDARS